MPALVAGGFNVRVGLPRGNGAHKQDKQCPAIAGAEALHPEFADRRPHYFHMQDRRENLCRRTTFGRAAWMASPFREEATAHIVSRWSYRRYTSAHSLGIYFIWLRAPRPARYTAISGSVTIGKARL